MYYSPGSVLEQIETTTMFFFNFASKTLDKIECLETASKIEAMI